MGILDGGSRKIFKLFVKKSCSTVLPFRYILKTIASRILTYPVICICLNKIIGDKFHTRRPETLSVKNNPGYVSVNSVRMLLKNSISFGFSHLLHIECTFALIFHIQYGKIVCAQTAYRTVTPKWGVKPYAISRIIQKIFKKKTFLSHGHVLSIASHWSNTNRSMSFKFSNKVV